MFNKSPIILVRSYGDRQSLLKGGFLLSRNFSVRTHINFTRANKIDIVREVTHIR